MNCIKCGKEIPDGENKLCDECKEKLLEDVASEKEQEVEKQKEKKKDEKKEKVTKGKQYIIICAIIFCVIVAIVLCLLFFRKSGVGNTIGNIRNYGYATIQNNSIYYLSPNEDSSKIGIFKVNKNGDNKQELLMENLDILSLNVVGNYIYFIGIGSENYTEEDNVDNKIYRMKKDGTNLQVINDNEFNDNCYEIYVVDKKIFYIGTDANIYKMNLDGSNRELVSENGTGYLGINEKYIIYNDLPNGETEETATDYTTYIMEIDGSNAREIANGKRMYSVNIKDDYIYYTNEEKQIYRIKVDGTEDTLICDVPAYNMNLLDDYIYYLNYKDYENGDYTVCIYKVKNDGSEDPISIKELKTYSSFVNVVGDWVLYMDSNDTTGYINLLKNDGSEEKTLYSLEYNNPKSLDDGTESVEATNEADSETAEDANVTE